MLKTNDTRPLHEPILNHPARLLIIVLLVCNTTMAIAQPGEVIIPVESFSIELSDEVQTAVDSGIALTFTCELAIRQSFWLFAIARQTKEHQFLLVRHSLSNRYMVKRDALDTPHMFRTISAATNYITNQAIILLESYNDNQNPYSMRLSLDKFKLPGPIRLNAFISKAWNLDTGWIAWRSAS